MIKWLMIEVSGIWEKKILTQLLIALAIISFYNQPLAIDV